MKVLRRSTHSSQAQTSPTVDSLRARFLHQGSSRSKRLAPRIRVNRCVVPYTLARGPDIPLYDGLSAIYYCFILYY